MEMEGKLPIISNSKEKCYQLIFLLTIIYSKIYAVIHFHFSLI